MSNYLKYLISPIKSNDKLNYLYRTFIFLSIEVLNRGMPLLVLPIVTSRYSLEEVGFFSFLQLGALYAFSLVSVSFHGITNVLVGKFYDYQDILSYKFRMLLQFILVLSVFLTIIVVLLQYFFSIFRFNNAFFYILLVCFLGAGNSFFSSLGSYYRGINKNKRYAVLNLLSVTIFIFLVFIGVFVKKKGIWILLFSTAMGYWFAGLLLSFFSLKLYIIKGRYFSFFKECIVYTFSISINDSMNLTSANSSRLVLGTYIGKGALANYHVAATITQIISIICQAFNLAYVPLFMARHFGSKNVQKTDPLAFSVVFSIFCSSILILFSFLYVPLLFGSAYSNVGFYIIFTMGTACLLPLYFVLTNALSTDSRIMFLKTIVNCMIAFLGLGMTYFLSLNFGTLGCMVSLPVTNVLLIVFFDILTRYRTKYRVPTYPYLLYIIVMFCILYLTYFITNLLDNLVFKFLLVLIFLGLIQLIQLFFYFKLSKLQLFNLKEVK